MQAESCSGGVLSSMAPGEEGELIGCSDQSVVGAPNLPERLKVSKPQETQGSAAWWVGSLLPWPEPSPVGTRLLLIKVGRQSPGTATLGSNLRAAVGKDGGGQGSGGAL